MQLFVHTANLNRCFHPERHQPLGHPRQTGWGELLSEGLASFHTSRRQHHWCILQRPAWWHGEILYNPKTTNFVLDVLDGDWVALSSGQWYGRTIQTLENVHVCFFRKMLDNEISKSCSSCVLLYCLQAPCHTFLFCNFGLSTFLVLFWQPWSTGMSQTLQMRNIAKHFHISQVQCANLQSFTNQNFRITNVHPWSLTWNLKMMGFQVRNLLFTRGWFSGEPC